MARKKTITKQQILNAAYDVVKTEGFGGFTARNIAKKMKCSTQPIYLEFKNMDDLKNELFEKIKTYLKTEIYSHEHTGDPLLDACLNYIYFADTEKVLFRALYIENHLGIEKMHKISLDFALSLMNEKEETKDLSEDEKFQLFTKIWIVAQGIASLLSSGLLSMNSEQVEASLNDSLSEMILSARYEA
ncbi:TetR/AcrR family transcriptional regulator [Carnobacterium gallinarum]|uniref:TetR/AcrR family transcriptional regulator n=1 Tax=Carnobacterium gallinarum TaxID=2749 RepID=UPI0005552ABF|nr:TetR/AcrR family transcriptional regulator [Carnobacterium gallinarum]